METIARFEFTHGTTLLGLSFMVEVEGREVRGQLLLSGVLSPAVAFRANTASRSVTFEPLSLSAITADQACLIACGLAGVVGPVVTCVKKAKNARDLVACLKKQGTTILINTAKCAIACVVKAGAGGGDVPL